MDDDRYNNGLNPIRTISQNKWLKDQLFKKKEDVATYSNDKLAIGKRRDGTTYHLDTKESFRCVLAGLNRCLEENTLVKTKEGDKKIKELIDGDFVLSKNFGNNSYEFKEILKHSEEEQECYEIELKDGRTVQASKNHVFFVRIGSNIIQKKLSELTVGDDLVCKGLSYEEQYGFEKSEQIKNKLRINGNTNKGKKVWENKIHPAGFLGRKHTEESKLKTSLKLKGRIPYVVTEKTKEKLRKLKLGKKLSEETKLKMSISRKGKNKGDKNPMFGKHLSDDTKKKISERMKGQKIIITEQWAKNISRGRTGIKLRDEIKQRMLKIHPLYRDDVTLEKITPIIKELILKYGEYNSKYFFLEKTATILNCSNKAVQRAIGNTSDYFKQYSLKPTLIDNPTFGRNEKSILDFYEKKLGYKILRKYTVRESNNHFFLDGYIPELNIAIEIDEKYHFYPNTKEKDKLRENKIKKALNCKFIRIKDNFGEFEEYINENKIN